MLIGIIGAMQSEVEALKKEMSISEELVKAGMSFYRGKIWGKEVVVVVSGVGKVNSAICTQIMIDSFDVDVVINVGVAGGVAQDISPGDVVIASSLIQHDVDVTMFGKRLGQIPNIDVFDFKSDRNLVEKAKKSNLSENIKIVEGVIVTGDQFVNSPEKAKFLVDTFNASATEMEGASIAHTAYVNKKPFIVIRSISDNASTGATVEFENFVEIAVDNSLKILKTMLDNM